MRAIPADLRIRSPWRTALPPFVLLLAVVFLLYRDTALHMAAIWWRSETFAHCMLVPPISLWLVWRRRAQLALLTPRAQPWMLLPLLAVALLWLLSDMVVVNAASQFALVAMVVLAVPAVLGTDVALVILFPLLFLFFGVPFGEFVLPTMMEWTADFTVAALQWSGVPVFREGQNFLIPSGSWSVIDECSGVRYLMASFMVGTLFGYLNYRSYKRRAVFMLVSLVVPVVANWLRAYLIVMMAHLSGNRIAVGVDHVLYGWAFFGIIVFIMFMVGARWSQPDDAAATVAARRGAARAGGLAGTQARMAVALTFAVIALLPPLLLAGLQRAEGNAAAPTLALPARLADGWSVSDAALVAWKPEFGSPSAETSRVYAVQPGDTASTATAAVGVHLAYYRGQSDERKLVSSQNRLVGMRDSVWGLPTDMARREVPLGTARTVSVRSARLLARATPTAARRSHLVVWRLYWIDGRFMADDLAAKLAGVWARLRGHGDEGAALVFYADGETVEASDAMLQAFVQSNLAILGKLLQGTQAAR